MRFVADENIKRDAIELLRSSGYEVYSIFESDRGLKNGEVFALTYKLNAVLITEDKKFVSNVVLGENLVKVGIIFVRLSAKQVSDLEYAQKILEAIDEYDSRLETSLTIIKVNRVRCQSLDDFGMDEGKEI